MMSEATDMESMIERVVHDQLGDDYANYLLDLRDRLDEAEREIGRLREALARGDTAYLYRAAQKDADDSRT